MNWAPVTCWLSLNATRSMLDGVAIIERIPARGCFVKVLDKPHLDLTTPLGRAFERMAEDERQRIVKRERGGEDAARERGAKFVASRAHTRQRDVLHATVSRLR